MPEVFRKYLDQTKKSPSSALFLNNANSVPSRGQVPGSKKKKKFSSSVCLDRRFWCCIISKKKSNFLGRKFLGFTLCFTGNENLIMRDIPPPAPIPGFPRQRFSHHKQIPGLSLPGLPSGSFAKLGKHFLYFNATFYSFWR